MKPITSCARLTPRLPRNTLWAVKGCGIYRSILLGLVAAIGSVSGSVFAITISSPAFPQGAEIPAKYTCTGQSISPELRITGVPSTAKSLALIAEDPDAPSGLFTHWLVWNMPPQTTKVPENTAPPGALEGTNDFSKRGYGAPCPPSGTHRYIFRVLALDRTLELKSGARRAQFDAAIKGHVMGQAELMGRYGRK